MKKGEVRNTVAAIKAAAFVFIAAATAWLLAYMLLFMDKIIPSDGSVAGIFGTSLAWIVALSLQVVLSVAILCFAAAGLFFAFRERKFSPYTEEGQGIRSKYLRNRILSVIMNIIAVGIALILTFTWGVAVTVYWATALFWIGAGILMILWAEIRQKLEQRRIEKN